MEKIEQEYIINIDDTISNFRAELAVDNQNIYTSSWLENITNNFNPDGSTTKDLSLAWRKDELTKIYSSLVKNKEKILDAIVKDYNIAREEAEIYEYAPTLYEVEKMIAKHEIWTVNPVDLAAEELGSTSFQSFINGLKSSFGLGDAPNCKILNVPYGITLILGPRKSDLSTLIKPLIASISAGNYTLIKASSFNRDKDKLVTETEKIVKEILKNSLDKTRALLLDDDFDEFELIKNKQVDMVFTKKTNNDQVLAACGKAGVLVKEHTSGWNVAVVTSNCNIKEAAELLIHNKFYKSGQHLDNVNVIYVDKSIYNSFLIESKNALYKFYTSLGQKNLNYGTMTSRSDFNKCLEILADPALERSQFLTSVYHNIENLRINPVLILNPSQESTIMNKKVYGPILPIITFEDILEIKDQINDGHHTENLYFFGQNTRIYEEAKTLFNYQNLFFNGTNFGVSGGLIGPDYGKDGQFGTSLGGRYGMWTFSKHKTFINPFSSSANGYLKGRAQKDFIKGKFLFF